MMGMTLIRGLIVKKSSAEFAESLINRSRTLARKSALGAVFSRPICLHPWSHPGASLLSVSPDSYLVYRRAPANGTEIASGRRE